MYYEMDRHLFRVKVILYKSTVQLRLIFLNIVELKTYITHTFILHYHWAKVDIYFVHKGVA
jgi:hypothetical protein